MKTIYKYILILTGCVLIASCNVEIKSDMKFSQIFATENKVVMADLSVGTHCDESTNAKVIQTFAKRGITARYNKCGYYYSTFSVPIQIVKGNEKPEDKYATLYFRYKNNQLTIETSSDYSSFIRQGDNDITFRNLEFEFMNDTQDTIHIKPSMSFVNDKAVENEIIEVVPFAKITIKLPDVSHQILKRSNLVYPVFQIINPNQPLENAAVDTSSEEDVEQKENTVSPDENKPVDKNILLNANLMKTITPEQLEEYISQGADVNAGDDKGTTVLMMAALSGTNPKILEILIDNGAVLDSKRKNGWTPLTIATRYNSNPKVIQTLLDKGAKIQNGKQLLDLLDKNENIDKNQDYRDLRNRISEKVDNKSSTP